jgi:signal transduction histidine kinase
VGCDSHLVLRASRERFITVLGHLIQNAKEATGEQGRVEVNVYRRDHRAVIEIHDNGCGMDERFIRERLFRPFNTTKGNAGMGIGVYESREFVHALGGEIDVTSKPGAGTTFFLRLPLFEKQTVSQESYYETEVLNCVSQPRSY